MEQVLNIVIPVFAIIFTGYLAGHFKVLGADSAAALNRFVLYFALPPLMFLSTARVPLEEILRFRFIVAYLLATFMTLILSLIGARYFFGIRGRDILTLHGLTAVFPNSGYLGIPLFLAAFGVDNILPAIVVTAATNLILLGLTIVALESVRGENKTIFSVGSAALGAMARSPLIWAPVAGMAVSAFDIAIPAPIVNYGDLLGATAGPGALFALGLSLVGSKLAQQIGELSWLVGVKTIIHPAVTWLVITYFFPVDAFWASSAVLLAAMPTGALVFVMAQSYNVYVQRSSAAILVSTIFSIATLSILLASV